MRNIVTSALTLSLGLALSGCAERVPEPVFVPKGAPHISWNIHTGDAENPSRTIVCQSDPRSECVLPVSREDRKVFASVHFFYHPAATETRYTGKVEIEFFDEVHELTPQSIVKAGGGPIQNSMNDFVTTKPGTYRMRIAIVATSSDTGRTQNIRDDVAVVVR